jgi:hypothetical protein
MELSLADRCCCWRSTTARIRRIGRSRLLFGISRSAAGEWLDYLALLLALAPVKLAYEVPMGRTPCSSWMGLWCPPTTGARRLR